MIKTFYIDDIDIDTLNKNSNYFIICERNITDDNTLKLFLEKEIEQVVFLGTHKKESCTKLYKLADKKEYELEWSYGGIDYTVREMYLYEFKNLETVLIYDDLAMMRFIQRHAEKLLKNNKYIVDTFDYRKYRHPIKRAEISCHTCRGDIYGQVDDFDYLWFSNRHLYGVGITDYKSIDAIVEMENYKKFYEDEIKVMSGIETDLSDDGRITIFARNRKGFNLITKIGNEEFYNKNLLSLKDILVNNKNNVQTGLPITNSKLIDLAYSRNEEELINLIRDYDFVELAPVNTYKYFYKKHSDDEIKEAIRYIIDISKKLNVLPVASSYPYYDWDFYRKRFKELHTYLNKELNDETDFHVYFPYDLLYEFDWLNDDDLSEEIVITNSCLIADRCSTFNTNLLTGKRIIKAIN